MEEKRENSYGMEKNMSKNALLKLEEKIAAVSRLGSRGEIRRGLQGQTHASFTLPVLGRGHHGSIQGDTWSSKAPQLLVSGTLLCLLAEEALLMPMAVHDTLQRYRKAKVVQ